MEESKLLVFDADIINEISTFIEKGNTYQADEGYNDDCVMCMVLFGWLSTMPFFKELVNVNTREVIYNQQMQHITQNLTPFVIQKGTDSPAAWVAGGDYWLVSDEYEKKLKESEFKY